MNILVDMNLSPEWCPVLEGAGHAAVHWTTVGDPRAADSQLMLFARERGMIVFTHDLGFSAMLAAAVATGPSLLQIRAPDPTPAAASETVLAALKQFAPELEAGAVVVVDPAGFRARLLPFR